MSTIQPYSSSLPEPQLWNNRLPTEVLTCIFEFANYPQVSEVCTEWRAVANNHSSRNLAIIKSVLGPTLVDTIYADRLEQLQQSNPTKRTLSTRERVGALLRHKPYIPPDLREIPIFKKLWATIDLEKRPSWDIFDLNPFLQRHQFFANISLLTHTVKVNSICLTRLRAMGFLDNRTDNDKIDHVLLDNIGLFLQKDQMAMSITDLLNLSNSQILSFPLSILNPLSILKLNSLNHLWLQSNKLSALPAEFGNFTNLTGINLANNRFVVFPTALLKQNNLTRLDMSNNRLSKIPDEIAQLNNLTSLNLKANQLSRLPVGILKLEKLRELVLSNNQISRLPTKSISNQTLIHIILDDNPLNTFPLFVLQCLNLKSLALANTGIRHLPKEIRHLNVEILDLASNQLEKFPKELFSLKNIRELYLKCNGLTELPRDISKMNRSLRRLDLSYNPIQKGRERAQELRNQRYHLEVDI